MAEDQTKSHWWLTLPGILTAIAGVIAAITGLLIGLGQVGLLPGQHATTEKSAPNTPSPTATSLEPPPVGRPPLPGTDAQGWLDSGARCEAGNPAVAMGRTAQSKLVLCQTGPGAFYYRGVRLSDGAVITLPNAVRSSGGFDVTNPVDGTRYEIRRDRLTFLLTDGRVADSQPMEDYWSS